MSEQSAQERLAALQARRRPSPETATTQVLETSEPELLRSPLPQAFTVPWNRVAATGASIVSFAAMVVAMGPIFKTVDTAQAGAAEPGDDLTVADSGAATPGAPPVNIEVTPAVTQPLVVASESPGAAADQNQTGAQPGTPAPGEAGAVAPQPTATPAPEAGEPTGQAPAAEPAPANPNDPTPAQPSDTQPPATQAPATQPPETQPPATEAPATQPPETQAPETQPPATQAPATQPPETQPPATQPPATPPPATPPPTTAPPATTPPTAPPATPPPQSGGSGG